MNKLTFWKYQGAGNDFVMIDNRDLRLNLSTEQIAHLCDRHMGIGGDGLMLIEPHAEADFFMRYYNSDGSVAEMCGNGARCITLFAHHLGIGPAEKVFYAPDGAHTSTVTDDNGTIGIVEVGLIDVEGINDESSNDFFLNTGVPHHVTFVDDITNVDIDERGREIRYSENYVSTNGTNANFAQIIDKGHIAVRTYERGVEGETLACGTGATACAIATHHKFTPDITSYFVDVLGGRLRVSFDFYNGIYSNVTLEGAATMVFKGEIFI